MEKPIRKRVLIGVLSSKFYLPTRGKAIQSTWLKEVDQSLADVKFFSENNDDYPTVQVSFPAKSCKILVGIGPIKGSLYAINNIKQFLSFHMLMTMSIRL